MNLNQSFPQKNRARNGFGFSTANVRQIMGPPARPPPKKTRQKSNSSASSATNWGRSQSVLNLSTLRSGSTTISSEYESRVITALSEGRGEARCEVGLASMDLSLPTLILCQISDSQSYLNTLTKINILNPTDIIVPTTFLDNNSRLMEKIKKKFPHIKILGIPRKTFNKNNGIDRILQLCLPSINTICVGLQHKYYALAAASALLTYLHNNLNIYYAKESLNISYQESEGYAVIDVSTADRLELVSCTKPAQASRISTLFGVLNYCHTKVGSRLLRSTILQPPCSPPLIENNLQCVTELIKRPDVLLSIQTLLPKLSTIDQLLTLTSMTLANTESCSIRQLNYLLLLNSLMDIIEPLKDLIQACPQPFFQELKKTLDSQHFSVITEKIRTIIHPSAQFAKGETGVTQRCFAIKSGVNGLLDLIRKTYLDVLNDLTEYVKRLGIKYNMTLSLGNNGTKGYHIVFKLNNQQKRTFKKSDLPEGFMQVCRLAGSFTMKTAELINYSTRLEDMMGEILKLSNTIIYKLMLDLKQYLAFFYKLCEDIARLDMLQSLAEASRRGNYVRPKFGSFTELTNANHPILELMVGERSVANHVSICPDYNVQIITGPNGSGKSIYIRQVMLLQVMAQVGCYIPAESAILKPMDRMFARIYLEDDIEYGASSFILEMKEVKYMMSLLSENSLFIIDELCRSTAADEGAAIAMATCEEFCASSAFLYITTHYTSLANLRKMYLNVKTWHMETIATGETPNELRLEFKYKLVPGVTNLKHYGVFIVKNIWPQRILDDVYAILDGLNGASEEKEYDEVHEALRLKYKLESDMRKLKSLGKLTTATINKLLNDYQNELQKMDIFMKQPQPNEIEYEPRQNAYPAEMNEPEDALETSSYKNLSNFLREDSDNVNLLVPEVNLEASEREILLNNSFDDRNEFEPDLSQTFEEKRRNCDGFETSEDRTRILEERESIKEFSKTSEEMDDTPVTQNDFKTSEEMDQTPITQWSNTQKDEDIEMKSLLEDWDSISQSFFDEDDDVCGSQASSYHTASNEVSQREEPPQHIFANVRIVEGPAWSPSSSQCTRDQQDDESITYSPLCSQQDEELGASPGNFRTSTTSSLNFIARGDQSTNIENVVTSDTNLAIGSTLRDITVEMKTLSSDKQTSDEQIGSNKATSSSSTDSAEKKVRKRRPIRFIPPKKLTRKEIQEEFAEQDRRFYESNNMSESDYSKYLAQVWNRPSIKQVQNSKHLVFARKTDDGVEVIPTPNKPKKRLPFERNSSTENKVDVSIFSDKNAKLFDDFFSSDDGPKRFKFNFEPNKNQIGIFQKSASEYAAAMERTQYSFKPSQGSFKPSQNSDLQYLTPEGFYKDNKEEINNIMNKYLREEQNDEVNIFETYSLHDEELQL